MLRRAIVLAGLAAVAFGAAPADGNWHAVATTLPPKWRLLQTARAGEPYYGGFDQACYGGPPASDVDEEYDCESNSLTVYTLPDARSEGAYDNWDGGAHEVTINGRPARWHWLTDDGSRYARELVWSPRTHLRVSVWASAQLGLGLHDLLAVGRGVKGIRERPWKRLLRQTSAGAQAGRIEPGMTRVEAITGTVDGDRWRLDVLIPPGYPLSRNDLRPACTELTFRGEIGHGEGCRGYVAEVAGRLFAFGPVRRSWTRVKIYSDRHRRRIAERRTHLVSGWDRDRFFALALPRDFCTGYVDSPDDKHYYGPNLIPPDQQDGPPDCNDPS